MNNQDMLFIRACKSRNPERRVMSVYRRFYWGTHVLSDQERICAVTGILTNLVNVFNPISAGSLIRELGPGADYKYRDLSFYERVFTVMVSRLRLTKPEKFPGYIAPAYFRNRNKTENDNEED